VDVRIALPADLDACIALFEAVAAEGRWLATEVPVDRREVKARWRELLGSSEGTLLLAEEAGAVIGVAVMVGRRAPELGMLVAAGHRRRGVGGALVRGCLAWARGAGARKIVLHVFPHNAAALALYRRHGFAEIGLVRAAFPRRSGAWWDAIRMELDLPRG
jgi:[ribosomal protein S18]-alanine N-acetyltransferase